MFVAQIPAKELIREDSNLWFADFYCVNSAHYVCVVITANYTKKRVDVEIVHLQHSGSPADDFCRASLIELDWESNQFMRRKTLVNKGVQYLVNDDVHVEVGARFGDCRSTGHRLQIFYTDDINIALRKLINVVPLGAGRSKSNGLPNNKECNLCNIESVSSNLAV